MRLRHGAILAFLLALGLAGPAAAQLGEPKAVDACPDNMDGRDPADPPLTCSCAPDRVGAGSVWGTDTYTADSAICRAAVHAGMIGRLGGEVTLGMLPGQGRYLGTTRNGVQSIGYGSYAASYRFTGDPVRPPPTTLAQCPNDMTQFDRGEIVTCGCPAAQTGQGSVWGTDTYTADSAPCRAALHAGMIGRQGGTVTLEMLPGEGRYPGTTRNGVQSINYGSYAMSYRFQGEPRRPQGAASPGGPTTCPDDLSAYAGSEERLTCICPGEATLRGSVWGTDIYSADSGACRAAVHAGALAVTGGTVSFRMLPGQPRYPGSTRNGVQSQNFGAYAASFQVEGGQRASAPVQAPIGASLRSAGQVQLYITFRTGSADLDIAAAPVLGELREALQADPGLRLRLAGHTDSTGSAAINLPLSQRRAEAVRQWLVANGIEPARLGAEGKGPSEPIADNATEAGRALNRRVQAVRLN